MKGCNTCKNGRALGTEMLCKIGKKPKFRTPKSEKEMYMGDWGWMLNCKEWESERFTRKASNENS